MSRADHHTGFRRREPPVNLVGMKVIVYSTKPYDEASLGEAALGRRIDLTFVEARLTLETSKLAEGFEAACLFVNDDGSRPVVEALAGMGIKLLVLRSAGFNHVDLEAAQKAGLAVGRVPAYSPHAVAEHAVALILGLARKTHRAYNRVRESNFSLNGLVGFDLAARTVGVVGTGAIGSVFARIMVGFGCRVIATDVRRDADLEALGVVYVERDRLFEEADVVSLHCPLTPDTHHLIDAAAFERMKDGVMLINTSRGALVDTRAAIAALKSRKLGYLGLDVYEEEEGVFFEDLSGTIVDDDLLMRLVTFPNVLITAHQAFLTREALDNIALTTIRNVECFEREGRPEHAVGG